MAGRSAVYRAEQSRAKGAVAHAVHIGRLVRPANCERCQGQTARIDAHHHNGYAPAHILDVTWLCRSCHQTIHGGDKRMIMPRGPQRPYETVAASLPQRVAANEWA